MDQNAFADPLSGSDSDSDDIFSYNEREQLPMVVASKSGDVDALRRALAAGGDPETLDGEGWTLALTLTLSLALALSAALSFSA